MLQGSVNKVDGMNATKGLYTFNSKGSSFIHGITTFLYSGLGAAAIPARLRLRRNFGERAFSPLAVLICVIFFLYLYFSPLLAFFDDAKEEENIVVGLFSALLTEIIRKFDSYTIALVLFNFFTLFIYKTITLAIVHFKSVYSKNGDNSYRYSFYRGEAKNRIFDNLLNTNFHGHKVDEKLIRMYFEPKYFIKKNFIIGLLALVITGFLAYYINDTYSDNVEDSLQFDLICIVCIMSFSFVLSRFSLCLSGLCLMAEEFAIAKKIRDTLLDTIDAEYDMMFLMKQKDLFKQKNIEEANLKIAEEIFQNPQKVDLASFPSLDNSQKTEEMSNDSGVNNDLDDFSKRLLQ